MGERGDADDLAFVGQLHRAFGPVASPQVIAKAVSGDPHSVTAIQVAEADQRAARFRVRNKLSPALQQSLQDTLGARAFDVCADCLGEGEFAGTPCITCGGLGLDRSRLVTDGAPVKLATKKSRPPMTPQERRLRAQIGAHASHVNRTGQEATAAARAAHLDKFEKLADPDGVLDPAERARKAAHLRSAYFLGLSLKSVRARRARRENKTLDV